MDLAESSISNDRLVVFKFDKVDDDDDENDIGVVAAFHDEYSLYKIKNIA